MFYRYLKPMFFRTIGRLSVTAMLLAAVIASAFTISSPRPAYADEAITPPSVPEEIQVPAGNVPYLVGHAVGTQNYICLPSASGFAWTFFGPQATLFKGNGGQIITHFLSPNPDEGRCGPGHVAALKGHQHHLGRGDRVILRPQVRCAGCNSLAPASSRWQ